MVHWVFQYIQLRLYLCVNHGFSYYNTLYIVTGNVRQQRLNLMNVRLKQFSNKVL
jgi:hypothetical protein